jgi:hypothetical protein
MEKLVYLLGDTPKGSVPAGRKDLREALLGMAPALFSVGARRVSFAVADVDDPDVARVDQMNASGLLDAHLSIWVDQLDERAGLEALIFPLAERVAGYLVTESILREYAKRDWAPGSPSPGIALVTTFPKPAALDPATFYARWHDSHGPLSLELHPLTRYVRNAVFRPITEGAPLLHAIVSESVASCAVAADTDQFYGGRENRRRVVKDLLSFVEIESLSTVVMRETLMET